MTRIDFSSDHGKRALQRLHDEQVIWLTTVNAQGAPQSRPVWFLWKDDGFTIYSQPDTPKLHALKDNARVSLNLNASRDGEDIVIFEGTARIVSENAPGTGNPEYVAKYTRLIDGWEPDDFAASFSVMIRATPTHLRSY